MRGLTHANRRKFEWNVLCLCCAQVALHSNEASNNLRHLRVEDFEDHIHRALFEEIVQAAKRKLSAVELRNWLPAAMTRRGWPDLDFDDLFSPRPDAATPGSLREAVETLRKSAKRTDGTITK